MGEPPSDDSRFILLSPADNVVVAREDVAAGQSVLLDGRSTTLQQSIARGHKLARRPIAPGDKVLKYGAPIGSATIDIRPGEHVHLHNLKSDYTASHVIAAAKGHGP